MTRAFHALWDALQHRSTMQGSIDRTCFVDLFEEAAAHAREHGEVPDWALAHLHATLSALDVDGDGGITRREYASWLAAIGSDACADTAFDLLDLDGNGELDIAEIEALFKQWLTQSGDTPGACLMTGRASE
jgi:Ca2+-binding EF-hand superfamily protein